MPNSGWEWFQLYIHSWQKTILRRVNGVLQFYVNVADIVSKQRPSRFRPCRMRARLSGGSFGRQLAAIGIKMRWQNCDASSRRRLRLDQNRSRPAATQAALL